MSGNVMKTRRPEPAEVEYKQMRFLIMDRPTDATIDRFIEGCRKKDISISNVVHSNKRIKELKRRGAKDVVRVCEPTYKTEKLNLEGIRVLDWQFDDGNPPPSKIVDEWFNLLKSRFREEPGCCVAVHCVAGLGRAPVLVALALIEGGLKYEDAVELIRKKRRGAINAKQLSFLEHYRPKSRLKDKNGHKSCVLM